jgi:hypothetical protein
MIESNRFCPKQGAIETTDCVMGNPNPVMARDLSDGCPVGREVVIHRWPLYSDSAPVKTSKTKELK